jgi:hypothetical protein
LLFNNSILINWSFKTPQYNFSLPLPYYL